MCVCGGGVVSELLKGYTSNRFQVDQNHRMSNNRGGGGVCKCEEKKKNKTRLVGRKWVESKNQNPMQGKWICRTNACSSCKTSPIRPPRLVLLAPRAQPLPCQPTVCVCVVWCGGVGGGLSLRLYQFNYCCPLVPNSKVFWKKKNFKMN